MAYGTSEGVTGSEGGGGKLKRVADMVVEGRCDGEGGGQGVVGDLFNNEPLSRVPDRQSLGFELPVFAKSRHVR